VEEVSLAEIAGLALVALVAGTVDALAGGGGLLTVPALLAAGLPPHLALGTNKGQSAFGSLSSLVGFWRAGKLDVHRVPASFAGGLLGSLAGAALVLVVSPAALKPLVLVLLVGAALVVALRRPPPPYDPALRPPPAGGRVRAYVWAIALLIGAYDGFFGPGTGTLVILAYAYLLREPMTNASANAKVVNFASNLAAVALFAAHGNVLWAVALPMGAAQVAGGVLGARLAVRGGDRAIRLVVLAVVLALSAKVAWDVAAAWRVPGR
jgi:uncharacterized membrane protein YfcA